MLHCGLMFRAKSRARLVTIASALTIAVRRGSMLRVLFAGTCVYAAGSVAMLLLT